MTTNTAGTSARTLPLQAVHYLRKAIAWNTAGITTASTVPVGVLPAGAIVMETLIQVTTAFNDSGTDTLIVGYVGATNALAITTDSNIKVAGGYKSQRGMDLTFAADTTINAQIAAQNGDSSAGAANIVVTYVVNNDG